MSARNHPNSSSNGFVDAMWLFNDNFERALAKFNEIKAQRKERGKKSAVADRTAKQVMTEIGRSPRWARRSDRAGIAQN